MEEFSGILERVAANARKRNPLPHSRAPKSWAKYSNQVGLAFCIAWSEELIQKPALRRAGLSKATIWRWRRRYPAFAAMFALTKRYLERHRRMFPDAWRGFRQWSRERKKLENGYVSPVGGRRGRSLRGPGRPSKYREQYCDEIQPSVRETADRLGVCEKTVRAWMQKHREFGRRQRLSIIENELPRAREQIERLGVRRPHRRVDDTVFYPQRSSQQR